MQRFRRFLINKKLKIGYYDRVNNLTNPLGIVFILIIRFLINRGIVYKGGKEWSL